MSTNLNFTLNTDLIYKYWHDIDPNFLACLKEIEKNEHWVVSENYIINEKLTALSNTIECMSSKEVCLSLIEINTIMSYLSISQMCYFLKYIDINLPGVLFHFVMESKENTHSYSTIFIKRLKFLHSANFLACCMESTRAKLISGLLDS